MQSFGPASTALASLFSAKSQIRRAGHDLDQALQKTASYIGFTTPLFASGEFVALNFI
jgi:hypothetical protein